MPEGRQKEGQAVWHALLPIYFEKRCRYFRRFAQEYWRVNLRKESLRRRRLGIYEMSKALIVFYSRAGENYVGGQIKDLETGNTETAALMIQRITNADIFKIEQKKPYSKRYNDCIEQARADQKNDARPEIKSKPESLDGYDTIYLGYPNYWGTMPMAVFTFLSGYDFSGKTIMPFCTHEGSGLGRSIKDISALCAGADIKNGLAITGGRVKNALPDIEKWISGENKDR